MLMAARKLSQDLRLNLQKVKQDVLDARKQPRGLLLDQGPNVIKLWEYKYILNLITFCYNLLQNYI